MQMAGTIAGMPGIGAGRLMKDPFGWVRVTKEDGFSQVTGMATGGELNTITAGTAIITAITTGTDELRAEGR
jgi:hypothetical protein